MLTTHRPHRLALAAATHESRTLSVPDNGVQLLAVHNVLCTLPQNRSYMRLSDVRSVNNRNLFLSSMRPCLCH